MRKFENSVTALLDTKAIEIATSDNRSKTYGVEGLEIGDKFTICKDSNGKLVTGGEFNSNNYLRFNTTGDRANISFTSLFGTSKPRKYFGEKSKFDFQLANNMTSAQALETCWKPEYRNEEDIIAHIEEYEGRTFECIGLCEDEITFDNPRTLYLFREIKQS